MSQVIEDMLTRAEFGGGCSQGFSLMPLAKDAELVAFGVCHDNPRLVTLANVDTLRAMSLKASHLGVLVIRPEVEMQPALNLLALIKPDKVQPWQAIRVRADLELLIRGVDHNPTKSRSPPLSQGHRIHRVNNYLFPFQGHPPSLGLPGTPNLLIRSGTAQGQRVSLRLFAQLVALLAVSLRRPFLMSSQQSVRRL